LDSVKNKLVKRKAEKELMDIRTKVKKTNAVEEFIKKEQSKAENEEDFEGDYECPILKDKARKKMEIQKELKALTKELRPKKKKEKMEELEEKETEEEKKEESKDKNDVLESYHKEKKRYAEVKAAKPIPKQKASENFPIFDRNGSIRFLSGEQRGADLGFTCQVQAEAVWDQIWRR